MTTETPRMRTQQQRIGLGLLGALALALAGCGGGGSGGGPPADPVYTAGKFDPPATFANYCAAPRSGTDTLTGQKYPDKLGSTVWEKTWIRAWSHAYYLWYSELPDRSPAGTESVAAYFDLMKTSGLNPPPSTSAKDKQLFHFTMTTAQYEALYSAGVSVGYGASWFLVPDTQTVHNLLYVAYIDPGTPAATANLSRGEIVLAIDGVALATIATQAQADAATAALQPSAAGQSHQFQIQELNGTQRTVTLVSANVTETPVQHVTALPTANGPVGYLQFNDHIPSAEAELMQAIGTLAADGVGDLIVDLRYNGGGLLDIASETAYMIAGSARTSGRNFESLRFNSQYSTSVDPVTGQPNTPTPFHSTTQFASSTSALPSLNLPRVIVISSSDTCSASESVINGLNGVNVTVVLIGGQTCGKPYGFYPQDNCGTTYFSIEFQGVNDAGFGDYPDGFVPANTTSTSGVTLPGCAVADDFTHALGDPAETRLSAALQYIASGTCPAPSAASAPPSLSVGHLIRPFWRTNRMLTRPR